MGIAIGKNTNFGPSLSPSRPMSPKVTREPSGLMSLLVLASSIVGNPPLVTISFGRLCCRCEGGSLLYPWYHLQQLLPCHTHQLEWCNVIHRTSCHRWYTNIVDIHQAGRNQCSRIHPFQGSSGIIVCCSLVFVLVVQSSWVHSCCNNLIIKGWFGKPWSLICICKFSSSVLWAPDLIIVSRCVVVCSCGKTILRQWIVVCYRHVSIYIYRYIVVRHRHRHRYLLSVLIVAIST